MLSKQLTDTVQTDTVQSWHCADWHCTVWYCADWHCIVWCCSDWHCTEWHCAHWQIADTDIVQTLTSCTLPLCRCTFLCMSSLKALLPAKPEAMTGSSHPFCTWVQPAELVQQLLHLPIPFLWWKQDCRRSTWVCDPPGQALCTKGHLML